METVNKWNLLVTKASHWTTVQTMERSWEITSEKAKEILAEIKKEILEILEIKD